MSKTPICDRWEYDTNQGGLVVPLNVAKDLETELAEANRKLAERINDDQRYLVAPLCNAEKALDDCQAELAEARAEIERKNKLIEQMRDALQACAEFIHYYDQEHNIGDGKVLEQALVALSAAERKLNV